MEGCIGYSFTQYTNDIGLLTVVSRPMFLLIRLIHNMFTAMQFISRFRVNLSN